MPQIRDYTHFDPILGTDALVVDRAGVGTGYVLASEFPGSTPTGVTPGSYTSTNITVNEYGQITNISNGGGGGQIIQHITSSPTSPGPDVNVLADVVLVTSSGSAGAEYINVPNPASQDITKVGHTIAIRYDTQGNAADVVHVFASGSGELFPIYPVGATSDTPPTAMIGYKAINGAELDAVGDATAFIRTYGGIGWAPYLADFDNAGSVELGARIRLEVVDQPAGSALAGEPIELASGAGDTAGDGGIISLTSGAGGGTGNGGDINITTGQSGADGSTKFAGYINLHAADGLGTNGVGGTIGLTAGNSLGTSGGGEIDLVAGNAETTGHGGPIIITAGDAGSAGGLGGWIHLQSGQSPAAASGEITVTTHDAGAGNSGTITLRSGTSTSTPGAVTLRGGDGVTNGNGGDVVLQGGTGAGIGVSGNVILANAPIADPLVVGAIWNSGGTLKISAGP